MAQTENLRESKSPCRFSGVCGCSGNMADEKHQKKHLRSFWSFYRHGFSKALKKSLEKYGWAILLLGLLYTIVAFFISSQTREEKFCGFDMSFWLTYAIPGVLLILFLAYHVARAPYEIYKEQYEKHESDIAEKNMQIGSLEEKLKEISNEGAKEDRKEALKQWKKKLLADLLLKLEARIFEIKAIGYSDFDSTRIVIANTDTTAVIENIAEELMKLDSFAAARFKTIRESEVKTPSFIPDMLIDNHYQWASHISYLENHKSDLIEFAKTLK
jgi:hypothetical protein